MIKELEIGEADLCVGGSLFGLLADLAVQAARDYLDSLAGPNA